MEWIILFFIDKMGRLRIRIKKEKKLIWNRFRHYMDFIILVCCLIIAFNIHPLDTTNDTNNSDSNEYLEKSEMTYIFHDYEWNEYIMNENTHWTSNSWDYLFEDEIPNDLKSENIKIIVSMDNNTNEEIWNNNWESVKNNQISIEDIITDLWSDWNGNNYSGKNILIINSWNSESTNEDNSYYIIIDWSWNNSSLIIEKINNNWEDKKLWNNLNENEVKDNKINNEEDNLLTAKAFTFIEEWWVLPSLVTWNDIYIWESDSVLEYEKNNWNINDNSQSSQWEQKKSGITIIEDYADCMTPRWYKIMHWESVLAYKQMDNAPDICNIERRFCWKWKLSGTYTQQWCSINENYTYKQRWDAEVTSKVEDGFKWWDTIQNPDWTVTVKNKEIWAGIKKTKHITEVGYGNNLRPEEQGIDQDTRVYWNCTTPRWEKIKHWEFVQAFKHENWFSDSPCEAQIRLCSMWELLWTYTESTCKTRNTSFIDRVNGSPTRNTYSKEKLELVKKQIKNEQRYYEKNREDGIKSLDSDALDRILWILDQD